MKRKVVVRLDPDVIAGIEAEAEKTDRSFSGMVSLILREEICQQQKDSRPAHGASESTRT